jgi:hypothetical protein
MLCAGLSIYHTVYDAVYGVLFMDTFDNNAHRMLPVFLEPDKAKHVDKSWNEYAVFENPAVAVC